MQHIQTVTVGSGGAASITFMAVGSIPADFTDLVVLVSARSDAAGGTKALRLKLNNITTNLTSKVLFGNGASASSFAEGNYMGQMTSTADTANTFGTFSIYIPNYRSTVAKSISIDSANENNATTAFQTIIAALWNPSPNAAITSLTLLVESAGENFAEHSSASLYGILAGSDGTTVVT